MEVSLIELKNLAYRLSRISAKWNEQTSAVSGESEHEKQCRNALSECGEIIAVYAYLLENICLHYEENEKQLSHITGEV